MFDRFISAFKIRDGERFVPSTPVNGLGDWLDAAGGTAFEGGLYRVHTRASAHASNALVRAAFPEFAARLTCFGYDWLGRQFATDTNRGTGDDPEVILFEPGTGEALEIPVPFSRFHDEELVDYAEDALARSFFNQWKRAGGLAPEFSECVGYRLPLFLGGKDVIENLEILDLDVYWTIMGQLRRRAKGLPVGTPIAEVFRDL